MADLTNANFAEADIFKADFRGANLKNSVLTNAKNFTSVIGIDRSYNFQE